MRDHALVPVLGKAREQYVAADQRTLFCQVN